MKPGGHKVTWNVGSMAGGADFFRTEVMDNGGLIRFGAVKKMMFMMRLACNTSTAHLVSRRLDGTLS
jgi:hypothetical protein